MKKTTIWLMVLAILVASGAPGKMASALSKTYITEFSMPKDFIWWLNSTTFDSTWWSKRYLKAYKEQGYILAPKIEGETLDELRLGMKMGAKDVSLDYVFFNENIWWEMYVYPVKYCREEKYYSDDIVTLAQNWNRGFTFDQPEEHWYIDYDRPKPEGGYEEYKVTITYQKKKLELGDHNIVDCVQRTDRSTYEDPERDSEDISLHFFTKDMWVWVRCDGWKNKGEKSLLVENYLLEAMKKCTFEKFSTNLQLKLNKKKNKISKKNAILSATLNNPTDEKFTSVEFCLYDKKRKKIKLRNRRKVAKIIQKRETVNIKFNVQKSIKEWRKKGTSKRKYPLERKKKYKYMIRAKVGGKYWEATGTFRLK